MSFPDHWCTPPPKLSPEALDISLDQWRATFLPTVIGPDMMPRASQCHMYDVRDEATLAKFLKGELPGNRTDYPVVACEDLLGYSYNKR